MIHRNANIQALTPGYIDRAYPLAREVEHDLSLEEWRAFASERVSAGENDRRTPGVLVAIRGDFIRGMAAYDLTGVGTGAQTLKATNIVTMDRSRDQGSESALLAGLLTTAERIGCARLLVELSDVSRWIGPRWSDPDGDLFRLPIDCVYLPGNEPSPDLDNRVVTLRQPA